ncbi:hypothetical protein V6N12_000190 [Hibiscus sabdariffa]|uniref:Uncharacterized protein n=1 Tax=Hibiscus sabdariffa TaxID=183260 RepID=A0ABR2AT50_9ROSI
MRSRRGGGINNNPSSKGKEDAFKKMMWYQQQPIIKGKEVKEDNYIDVAFDDSDDDYPVDENVFDDSTDELLIKDFNSSLS